MEDKDKDQKKGESYSIGALIIATGSSLVVLGGGIMVGTYLTGRPLVTYSGFKDFRRS